MACLEEWIFKVCIQNKRLRHKSELPLKRNLGRRSTLGSRFVIVLCSRANADTLKLHLNCQGNYKWIARGNLLWTGIPSKEDSITPCLGNMDKLQQLGTLGLSDDLL